MAHRYKYLDSGIQQWLSGPKWGALLARVGRKHFLFLFVYSFFFGVYILATQKNLADFWGSELFFFLFLSFFPFQFGTDVN